MPEGPEVEKVRVDLSPILGKIVESSYFTKLAMKYPRYNDQDIKISDLKNSKLRSIERKGKYLIWKFENTKSYYILNHLGMTGSWTLFNVRKELKKQLTREKKNYIKVVLEFTDESSCIFEDMRNFGRFQVFQTYENLIEKYPAVKKIGLDGFKFELETFKELLDLKRNKSKQLGILLLDQRLIAGIGNIYKSESLWRAKISPFTTPEELTPEELKNLAQSIQNVLQDAFKDGGSTISNFKSNNEKGEAQSWHAVYSKEKKPCPTCNTIIKREVQAQRSTFYCPTCQPIKKSNEL